MRGDEEGAVSSWRRAMGAPFGLHWVWLCLPAAVVSGAFAMTPVVSWDYWWHITMGGLSAKAGAPVYGNLLLFTLPEDAPSLVQPWLSQRLMYEAHRALGIEWVMSLRNLVATLGVLGVTLVAGWRGARREVACGLGLVCGLMVVFTVTLRTTLFVWPVLLGLLAVCFAARRRRVGVGWAAAALVCGAALWANLHGSFFLAAALALAFGAAEVVDARRGVEGASRRVWAWGAAFAGAWVTPLLNPRGAELYTYLWGLSSNRAAREMLTEWWPTTPLHPEVHGPVFYVCAVLGLGAMWRARARLDPVDLFLLLGFCVITLGQARGLLWFGFVFPLVVAPYVGGGEVEQGDVPDVAKALHVGLAAVMCVAPMALYPWSAWANARRAQWQPMEVIRSGEGEGVYLAPTPREVTAWARPGERVFHGSAMGGYVAWSLFQRDGDVGRVLYVDQRIELPTYEHWGRYDGLKEGVEGWEDELDRWDVRVAFLGTKGSFGSPGLVEGMRRSGRWELVSEREYVAVFRRR